jgi:hypothetical protein
MTNQSHLFALVLLPLLACTGPLKNPPAPAGASGTGGRGGNNAVGGTGGTAGTGGSAGAGGVGGTGSNENPDAAMDGDGSGGGAVLERIFTRGYGFPYLVPCDANGACPEGQKCFRLAAELAVCDKAERPVMTACALSGADECGCGGAGCGAGQTCAGVFYTAHLQNDCLDTPCAGPEECTSGSVCTPTSLILDSKPTTFPAVGRCFTPACRSDADCTGGDDGRCALVMTGPPPVAGTAHMDKVGCVFAGLWSAATACPPDQATSLFERDPLAGTRYYTCAGR